MSVAGAMLLSGATFAAAEAQTLNFGPTGAGGTGTWDTTTANWFDGSTAVPWASGGTAVFGGTAGTVTVNGTVAAGGAIFNTNGYTITGGTLTLSGPMATLTTNTGVSATINSAITGSAALVKAGAGTLTIGNAANTYTGGTTVSQGSLIFGGNQALGSGTVTLGDANTGASDVSLLASFPNFFTGQILNDIVVNNPGSGAVSIGTTSFNVGANGTIFDGTITLNGDVTFVGGNADRTTFSGPITGTGDITVTGSRVTISSDANDFVGSVTISPGNLLQADRAFVLPSTTTLNILGNGVLRFTNTSHQTIDGLNGSANAFITRFNGAQTLLTVGAEGGSGTFQGVIGGGISFTKAGAGTQVMSGLNAYNGPTTISGGVLSTPHLANGGAQSGIGASSSTAPNLVLDGGTLQYTGAGASTDRQFTLTTNGGGIDASGSGALNFTSTAAIALGGTGPRTLTLAGSNSAANTLGAVLADSGGSSSLAKTGTGRWVLTGNNSYTGDTLINDGTLALSATGSIASSARVIADGTFDISDVAGSSSSIRSLAGSGSMTLGPKTLVITAANDTFAGHISGSGGLTITGGTQTLSGANTYAGPTTVQSGSLIINGDQSSATGLTSVEDGATLGGTGIVGGDVTVADGAAIDPGDLGIVPGTLTINGALALSAGSDLNYNFGQANVVGGAFNDLMVVGGDLDLDGTLNVTQSAGASFIPGIYRIISYQGTLTDNGLELGTMPPGDFLVQTSIDQQVNLVNTTDVTLNFWDGPGGTVNDGSIHGGDGVWRLADNDHWTNDTGLINAPYSNGAFAVFAGQPGTVTIDDGNGQVEAVGMQFASDGYVIDGVPHWSAVRPSSASATARRPAGT